MRTITPDLFQKYYDHAMKEETRYRQTAEIIDLTVANNTPDTDHNDTQSDSSALAVYSNCVSSSDGEDTISDGNTTE
eukprot:IDg20577t1